MDYETKIYLDKLVEAVDKLDSPDWWMIVLTIINIGAFIFVAYAQVKMQRQQMKMQKQESYKDINKLIQTIHSKTDSLLHNITLTLSVQHYDNFSIEYLTNRKIEFSELNKKFLEYEAEIQLKLGETHMQHIYYTMLLITAHDVVDTILHNVNYNEFVPLRIDEHTKLNDENCIVLLLEKVTKDNQSTSKGVFDYFVKMKNCVSEHSLLNALNKHCK